jgi:hypothetical protein
MKRRFNWVDTLEVMKSINDFFRVISVGTKVEVKSKVFQIEEGVVYCKGTECIFIRDVKKTHRKLSLSKNDCISGDYELSILEEP